MVAITPNHNAVESLPITVIRRLSIRTVNKQMTIASPVPGVIIQLT